MVEQRGIEPLISALRIRHPAKNVSICLSKAAATEENPGFLPFLPFLTIASMACAVESVYKLTTRNPETLGVFFQNLNSHLHLLSPEIIFLV